MLDLKRGSVAGNVGEPAARSADAHGQRPCWGVVFERLFPSPVGRAARSPVKFCVFKFKLIHCGAFSDDFISDTLLHVLFRGLAKGV